MKAWARGSISSSRTTWMRRSRAAAPELRGGLPGADVGGDEDDSRAASITWRQCSSPSSDGAEALGSGEAPIALGQAPGERVHRPEASGASRSQRPARPSTGSRLEAMAPRMRPSARKKNVVKTDDRATRSRTAGA